jgi:purine-binding chemotaxis protein CheW
MRSIEEAGMAVSQTERAEAAAQTDGHTSERLLQVVSFRLGGEEYGLEILRVQEIIRMVGLTRVPNSRKFVEGVINLRGKLIPILGLRKRFGLEPRESDRGTRIIVVEVAGEVIGFEVDSVSEVLRIPVETIEPPPRLSRHNNEYVSGVGKLQDRLLLLLDINRVLAEPSAEPVAEVPAASIIEEPVTAPEEALVS